MKDEIISEADIEYMRKKIKEHKQDIKRYKKMTDFWMVDFVQVIMEGDEEQLMKKMARRRRRKNERFYQRQNKEDR